MLISQQQKPTHLIQIKYQKLRIQLFLPLESMSLFGDNNNLRVQIVQMNDELLLDIPIQNQSRAQSMYQQLRRTSQKWFTRSRKSIFGSSKHKNNQNYQQSVLNHTASQKHIQRGLVSYNTQNLQKMSLMNLMREQIQISCKSISNRMSHLLKEQAMKIKTLGELLVKNQNQLTKKNQMMQQIIQKINKLNRTDYYSTENEKELDAVLGRRIMDLQNGLQDIQSIINKKDGSSIKVSKLETQFKQTTSNITKEYFGRVNQVREILEEKLDRIQKMLQMNSTMNRSLKTSSVVNKNYDQIDRKLSLFTEQIQGMRLDIELFKKKKYIYDNYNLQEVQTKINIIERSLSNMQINGFKRKQITIRKSPTHRLFKSSQLSQMTRPQISQTGKTSSKSKFVSKYKSLINNRKQREQYTYSSSSPSDNEAQQAQLKYEQASVQRFLRVLKKLQIPQPLLVETDQTGYLKSAETGMYLVDTMGNGFEFSPQTLSRLSQQGIITQRTRQ